ncbi:MAG: L,D-transpeptidase family protein [Clostridia bacterium]
MNKTDFLQAKATYLIANPDADELSFYLHFTTEHPGPSIGWLHLGREYQKQGNNDKAFEAFRRALHSRERSPFAKEAREAYQELLRQRRQKRQNAWRWVRRSLLLLFALLTAVLFPADTRNAEVAAPAVQASPPSSPAKNESTLRHTEVIAVPDSVRDTVLAEQIRHYLKSRRFYYNRPFTVIAVPEAEGVPLFTPLPFYRPDRVRGVVTYDPSKQAITTQKLFAEGCPCQNEPIVIRAKKAFHDERLALEQALTLRNALYRTYQSTGKLPARLSELAQPFPANRLPSIPQLYVPPPVEGLAPPDRARYIDWPYHPGALNKENAWKSMSSVLPLPFYPEPAVGLEPLQIIVQQKMVSLRVMSGQHLLRQYPIGIGKEERTPEGYFSILQKVSQPRSATNAYGTRGMVFTSAKHAIHGTNKPESIGQSVSLGCIRLHNADVEELYSFASLGTEVIISDKSHPKLVWNNAERFYLPTDRDEETPQVVYHWLE